MCCDGTLFHSVILQRQDSARTLTSLGFTLKRKKGVATFRQPCTAHEAKGCKIYSDRPTRCRLFDCQQVLRVRRNEISEAEAKTTILKTRNKIRSVLEKVERLVETNPQHGLAQRVATAVANSPESVAKTDLVNSMSELEEILERDFRVPEQSN